MKRAFVILFLFLTVLYARQGYELLTANATTTCLLTGRLSEIAEEVVAIPLQKNKSHVIPYAKQVRKEGENLFLVCNETLYRFSRKGEFLNAVTNPEQIRVGGYIIDNRRQQLIVLGNENDIHYYTFNGKLIETKKLKNTVPDERVHSIALYQDSIWTTESRIRPNRDTNRSSMEILAVKYDTSFTELECKKIAAFDTRHEQLPITCFNSELNVHPDTGVIYLYTPPLSAEYLLSDTLSLLNQPYRLSSGFVSTFPTRMGKRFWLAACQNNRQPLLNYFFCYDTDRNRAWQLADGFSDDYYQTGQINNLLPLDIYNEQYYFCKSGIALKEAFPQAFEEDTPVVFLVKLRA